MNICGDDNCTDPDCPGTGRHPITPASDQRDGLLHCAEPGCLATHKSDKWNNLRAAKLGWFLQRNGDKWCPEHTPEWVPAWRESQRDKRSAEQRARDLLEGLGMSDAQAMSAGDLVELANYIADATAYREAKRS